MIALVLLFLCIFCILFVAQTRGTLYFKEKLNIVSVNSYIIIALYFVIFSEAWKIALKHCLDSIFIPKLRYNFRSFSSCVVLFQNTLINIY